MSVARVNKGRHKRLGNGKRIAHYRVAGIPGVCSFLRDEKLRLEKRGGMNRAKIVSLFSRRSCLSPYGFSAFLRCEPLSDHVYSRGRTLFFPQDQSSWNTTLSCLLRAG